MQRNAIASLLAHAQEYETGRVPRQDGLPEPFAQTVSPSAGWAPYVASCLPTSSSSVSATCAACCVTPSTTTITFDGRTYTSTEAFKGRVMSGITRNLAASDGVCIEDLWGPPVGVAAKFAIRLHIDVADVADHEGATVGRCKRRARRARSTYGADPVSRRARFRAAGDRRCRARVPYVSLRAPVTSTGSRTTRARHLLRLQRGRAK